MEQIEPDIDPTPPPFDPPEDINPYDDDEED